MKSSPRSRIQKISALSLFFCVILAISSCTPKQHGRLNTLQPEALLNVRLVNYGLQVPFCGAIIQVYRDGSYVLKVWRINLKDRPPNTYRGTITPQLMYSLKLVCSTSVVQNVDGVPTYDFEPDDSHHRPPKVILELLETVYPRSRQKHSVREIPTKWRISL
jgi:hypothetical protein